MKSPLWKKAARRWWVHGAFRTAKRHASAPQKGRGDSAGGGVWAGAGGKALECIANMVSADSAIFVNSNGLPDGAEPFEAFNVPHEALKEYMTSFASRDVQLEAVASRYGTQRPAVIHDDEFLPYKKFVRSDLFNDLYRRVDRVDLHRFIILESSEISRQGIATMRLVCARGRRDADQSFTKHDLDILRALSPHFDAAAILFIERRAQANASLAAAFEYVADAVAILDVDGRVRYANAAFETLQGARSACQMVLGQAVGVADVPHP